MTAPEAPLEMPSLTFNLADLFERVAQQVPDRIAIVIGDRRVTYGELDERSTRFANYLISIGVQPGDTVGINSYNRIEWIEAMFGAYKARAVAINLNYRYVGEELRYVLDDADVSVLVFERSLASVVEAVQDQLPQLRQTLVLEDGTAEETKALPFEEALASVSADRQVIQRSPDDLYLLYTGGTTGMPKGVIWRHEDLFFAALGGAGNFTNEPITEPAQITSRILPEDRVLTSMINAPIMHGAAQWNVMIMLFAGAKVVFNDSHTFDPHHVWELVERERANSIMVVGDAVARPLAEALAAPGASYDLSCVVAIGSGGAVFSQAVRDQLKAHLPQIITRDSIGGSELGASGMSAASGERRFIVRDGMAVLRDDLTQIPAGADEVGRLARSGNIPLGYRKDPVKTAATYPTDTEGVRWSIPGDYARHEADGTITLLGRGSSSINTGGEKVYPEEVEAALKSHPDVFDVVVVGLPDERFGQRIAAVVHARVDTLTLEDLQAHARDHIAGYKIPRQLHLAETIQRTVAGKPDYQWAKAIFDA
jgi:acyl-CoA synthetase (AMP-forming)/AMP-acid ligase II